MNIKSIYFFILTFILILKTAHFEGVTKMERKLKSFDDSNRASKIFKE